MKRIFAWLLVAVLAFTPTACRLKKKAQQQPAPATRVEHFKQKQIATDMTDGKRILTETVEETADGKIKYKTDDGRTWVVEMTPVKEGGYRYGTPQEVK